MAIYKRGGVYWYSFVFNGDRIQESTKQGTKRVAEQMEAAHKTSLAKGEVGIRERQRVPTLREFAPRFTEAIETQCAEKPRTVDFYKCKLALLLKHEPLASARLDAIEEAAIDSYKNHRSKATSRNKKPLAPATVNRELATLRRLLRLAHEWKIIQRVPRFRLLRGERQREFILSLHQEAVFLAALPPTLLDVAILLLDTGLRVGEVLSLEWPQVHMELAHDAKFGHLTVLSGKAKSKKSRNVPLSQRVVAVLMNWRAREKPLDGHSYVLHRADGSMLYQTWLNQQHAKVRETLNAIDGFQPKFPTEFVLHSLRHTFGTRLGEAGADAFTIMRLMGHSTVIMSQRYVHPSPESVELAFGRMMTRNLQRVPTVSATSTESNDAVVS